MPLIYLSPSTQENNYFVSGGTEEEYMNRLADAMVPFLYASGIRYVRNTPDMTAAGSIIQSNAGNYDLHLALHSFEEHRHNVLDCRLCALAVNSEHSAYLIECSALKHHLHNGFHIHGLYPPCRLANSRNTFSFVVKF